MSDNHDLTKEERAAKVAALGLTIEAVFVPFSQSRNKAEKMPSLNWRVIVKRNGRAVLETDYVAGCGHAPSYKQHFGRRTIEVKENDERVKWECEYGRPAGKFTNTRSPSQGQATIKPDTLDVLASLAMDSNVLDAGGFEDWARDLGFDTDSRKAEATYKACIEIALKLRAALGDAGLAELRNTFEGY